MNGAAAELGPGESLGGYVLTRDLRAELGQRGLMRAYAGLDLAGMDEVLVLAAPEHGALREEAAREFRVFRELHGETLATPLRLGEERDALYVSFPWRPGLSLRQVLAGGPLPATLAARVLWRLAAALATLHGRSLFHGDVRPELVRVRADGKLSLTGALPSVFRMAREMLGEGERPSQYWAPEIHRGEPSTPASDVYSLALVAYELFSGKSLLGTIKAGSPESSQRKLHEALERGVQLGRQVPSALEKILRGCLHIDPAARPRSSHELAPALQAALAPHQCKAELAPRMKAHLPLTRWSARARLLRSAGRRVAKGEGLAAAARVRAAVGLGVEKAGDEPVRIRELLAGCLWTTFLEGPGATPRAREALCLTVYRAAKILGSESLTELARRRLIAFADPTGPLEPLLGPPPSASVAAERDRLRRRVTRDPFDDVAVLGLAVLQGATAPKVGTVEELRREVCAAEELAVSAAALGGVALAVAADPAAALARLGELVDVSRGVAAAPRPAHEELDSGITSGIRDVDSGIHGPDSAIRDAPDLVDASGPSAAGPALSPAGTGAAPLDLERPLTEARQALGNGDLVKAAQALARLADLGASARERTHAAVVAQARSFLWVSLMPAPDAATPRDQALAALLPVLRAYGVEALVPLCERLLVMTIPEAEQRTRLASLLEEAPDSLEILQAASRVAAGAGDDSTWVRHLEEAGERFLEIGEMTLASRMYMAIRAIQPTSAIAMEGMEKVMALGQATAEAGQRFQAIRAQAEAAEFPSEALIPVKGFLALHPTFLPALEAAAHLYGVEGKHHEAADIHLELGKRALMREEPARARGHFRKVLENDLENDEALMYLAAVEPPGYDAPREVWRLRVHVLEREGLVRAAMHHARKELTGEATDFPILATLAGLARKAGEDPSPLLALQGHLALEQGNLQVAADCFRAAIQEAPDPSGFVDELLQVDGVLRAIPMHELEALRG